MDSSEEEEIALLSVILFDNKRRRKQAKKRRFWVREIFQRREEHGAVLRLSATFFIYLFICTLYFKMSSKRNFYLQCDFIIFLYNF